jgi:ABC-2 type transport system ATP-binding protein
MPTPILDARNLVKRYGDFTAVNDISFVIEDGEIFGLLGPNGAGKSTTIAMLSGLFSPTAGGATVAGLDIVADTHKMKQRIGVVPQDLALYQTLNARENVGFFGQLYGLSGKELRARTDEVLSYVGMLERAQDKVNTYSGGMKRRLNLAIGLVNNPQLLFLDEPTVGVDPQSRNHIFESVARLNRERGMSVLYTTHYMEEAERLCHRVGIIDHGKLIALDTPRRLIEQLGGGILQIGVNSADQALCAAIAALPAVKGASYVLAPADGVEATYAADPQAANARPILKIEAVHANEALLQVLQYCNEHDIVILSLEVLEPNLETVFLNLTGKSLRE